MRPAPLPPHTPVCPRPRRLTACARAATPRADDVVENVYHQDVALEETAHSRRVFELWKWGLTLAIGMSTGLTAYVIKRGVDYLDRLRFQHTLHLIEDAEYGQAFVYFAGLAVAYVLVAAVLVAYIEPVACGSGIPEMKGYLNGAKCALKPAPCPARPATPVDSRCAVGMRSTPASVRSRPTHPPFLCLSHSVRANCSESR